MRRLTVSSVSAGLSMPTQRPDRPQGPPPGFEDTAKLLGLDSDTLKSQLQSGQTLDDIASAQGVSHDDLVSTIAQGLKVPEGVDPTQVAEAIASGQGPQGGQRPGGPPPSGDRRPPWLGNDDDGQLVDTYA